MKNEGENNGGISDEQLKKDIEAIEEEKKEYEEDTKGDKKLNIY